MSEDAKAALLEWLHSEPDALEGDPAGVAERAFAAGMKYAAILARGVQIRYTCRKMRGVCAGISDTITAEAGRE